MGLLLRDKLTKKHKLSVYVLLLTGLTALTSCANYLGIKSHKKTNSPDQLATQKSIPNQQGNWPTTDWVKQFGDPQLAFLIDEALANNPNIQIAQARIMQAQALVSTKSAAFLPTMNLNSQVARGLLSATVFPRNFGGGMWYNLGEFMTKTTFELDLWGKNLANYRQAVSQLKMSEVSEQEARLALSTTIATTYNQLAYYYGLREILKRTIDQRVSLNKITSIRLKNGLDTKVQLYQSQNTTAAARTQLAEVQGQIILTRQQLGALLGKGPDRGLSIKRPSLKTIKTPRLPAALPLNLLGRRPDIVGARWNVEAACQGIKNAKAQFYPNVNIVAFAGFLSLGVSRLFEQASREYQVGPALSLPILDAGILRAQLSSRYGIYEEAVAQYNNTLNNALADVAGQIASIQATEQQLKAQKEAYVAAQHSYNLGRIQYRDGLASQLVVLDAETMYLNAQQLRLQLNFNRRALQIALIKALGGGFAATYPIPNKKIPEYTKLK